MKIVKLKETINLHEANRSAIEYIKATSGKPDEYDWCVVNQCIRSFERLATYERQNNDQQKETTNEHESTSKESRNE